MVKRRGPALALATKIIATAVLFVTLPSGDTLLAQDSLGELMGHVVDRSAAVTPVTGVKVTNDDTRQPNIATQRVTGQETICTFCPTIDPAADFSFARIMGNSPPARLSTLSPGTAGMSYPSAPLTGIPPQHEKLDGRAFPEVAQPEGKQSITNGDKLPFFLMCLAVHAAVTMDAWSTNDVFHHHFPLGYRPVEEDPIMRPFAGSGAMYPMENLLFAVPFDFLLYKTRQHHGPKVARVLAYAAASTWVGLEFRQSIINVQEEHLGSSRVRAFEASESVPTF